MASKKLGIGTIEINKKFKDKEEAYKYAKRLIEHIRYLCSKNADRAWYAQAMVSTSNMKKEVSQLRYINSGKVGRPKKELYLFKKTAYGWYKGDYTTDWHLHILIVSNPSYSFRNALKEYIDRNWKEIEDVNKENGSNEKAYKKICNIKIADYFIAQTEDILFCNCNYGESDKLKYSLKEYYNESLKSRSKKERMYKNNIIAPISEKKQLKELNKADEKLNEIKEYYLEITKENEKKENDNYMKKVKVHKIKENYNKVQENSNNIILENALTI